MNPHMLFPSLGRLRNQGSGYSWEPLAFNPSMGREEMMRPDELAMQRQEDSICLHRNLRRERSSQSPQADANEEVQDRCYGRLPKCSAQFGIENLQLPETIAPLLFLELDVCSSGMSPNSTARPGHPNHLIGLLS
jgi:hypothetical protein